MMINNKVSSILLLIVLFFIPYSASAALLTGTLQDVRASGSNSYYWGDGVNDLFQAWSENDPNYSGWFYGSSYSNSNADVYVYYGLSDPTIIDDASVFDYFDSSYTKEVPGHPDWPPQSALLAYEGSTVFFRGVNGYYGAWYIEDIYPVVSGGASLNGTWYFIDDGTANFSSVPIPGAIWLLGSGILGLIGVARRKVRV